MLHPASAPSSGPVGLRQGGQPKRRLLVGLWPSRLQMQHCSDPWVCSGVLPGQAPRDHSHWWSSLAVLRRWSCVQVCFTWASVMLLSKITWWPSAWGSFQQQMSQFKQLAFCSIKLINWKLSIAAKLESELLFCWDLCIKNLKFNSVYLITCPHYFHLVVIWCRTFTPQPKV